MPRSSSFSSRAFHGGYPKTISQKIIPRDQMSHFVVYWLRYNICGAIQIGLPTHDFNICDPKLSTYFANPKSPILQTPSLIRILAGLRSLCTIFSRISSLKPARIWRMISKTSSSLNFFRFISSFKSPFLQNSVIMQRLFLEERTSLNLTMLAWLNLLSRYIQEKIAFSRYLSLVKVARSIFLMATFSLVSLSIPQQTFPQTPYPKHFEVWYEQLPITLMTTSFI